MTGKSVSLVLGSGGARGLAHIGVIQWLEANGYRIRSIAGASMGAVVGGIYAAGQLDLYTRWVSALERRDVLGLLDFSFSANGLFKGERIIGVLRELVGEVDIEDLPITFTAVATDLEEQREVWLNRGPLFDALRASISIPTVFTPYRYLGKTLVDGGLVNPLPIAPTLWDATDLTVAVSLSGRRDPALAEAPAARLPVPAANDYHSRITAFIDGLGARRRPPQRQEPGLFDVIARSMDTMQGQITRCKLAAYSPDVTIEVPRNVCTFFDFHRAVELIEIGRSRAAAALG